MELAEGLVSSMQEDDPSPLKVPPFTPTHHLRDQFFCFTEFLLGNVEEWSCRQPPWPPPPPPITFSGSDRFIKGRLPHRTMAIAASLSSLIGDATPLPDARKHGVVHADHDDTLDKMQDVRLDNMLSKMHDATHGDDDYTPAAANAHSKSSIHDLSSDSALNFDAHWTHPQADDSISSSGLVDVSACSTDKALEVDTDYMPPQDVKSIRGLSANDAIDVTACRAGSSLEVDTECRCLQDGSVQGISSNEAGDVAACGTDNHTNGVYVHDDGTVLPLHETVLVESLLSMQSDGLDGNVSATEVPDGLDGNVSTTEVLDGSVHGLDNALVVDKNRGCRQNEGECLAVSEVSLETVEGGNVVTETPEDAEEGHGHSLRVGCKISLQRSFTNVADGLPEPSPTKIHADNVSQGTEMEAHVTLGFDAQLDDLEEGELSERLPDDEYLDTLEEGKATGEAEMQGGGSLDATGLEPNALESTTDDEMDQPISLFVSRYRIQSNKISPMKKGKPLKKRKTEDEEQVLQELVSADAGFSGQSGQVRGIQEGSSKVSIKRARGARKGGPRLSIGNGNANKDGVVESGLSWLSIGSKVDTSEHRENLEDNYAGLGAAQVSGHQVMSVHAIKERAEGASCTPSKGLARHSLAGSEQFFVPEKHKGLLSMVVEEGLCLSTIDVGNDQLDVGNDQKLASHTKVASVKPKRTLTEQRKKKRQQAKHRKRDKRLEALGIRKLKLKPFVEKKKEKVIKICTFYAKGKCSKGTSCTFSHDVIPTTKSEMCKYFKNNCCLKGDDCPYSHELSSFPCKFFHTRGYCLDADSCRFSHEPISEEAKQELHRKNEQKQRVGEGIVNEVLGHANLKHSMPLCNLRGNSVDKTAEGPQGKDAVANSSSLTRFKKGFVSTLSTMHTAEVSDKPLLIAAKNAASTSTIAPTNAAYLDVNRSLFCGGSLHTRGSSPCKSKDQSAIFTTQSTGKQSGQLLGPGSDLATGNSIPTQDRKTKIDAFLQAQLDDSRLIRKSKLAMGPETVGGCYSLSDQRRALPIGQTSLLNEPSTSLSSGWNAKAKGSFQASLDHGQLIANLKPTDCTDFSPNSGFLIGRDSVSNRRLPGMGAAASGSSVSAPTLLDLILKPQEAAVPEWQPSTSGLLSMKTDVTPKRSRADTILDRFL